MLFQNLTRLTAPALILGALCLSGCPSEGPVENAAEKVDDALTDGPVENAGEKIDDAAKKVENAAEDVTGN